ncbi:Benzyl alcohol O-benzoyltransferase [Acorus gramineus]|uniref:Benzyl alcohol O-benzoyltransferase n=1 Tax=Acorus gramineus TaxID=55184 RepID=A0AAV9AF40_ACOGR|nr:Benzyl alcohol O-benzoyltransferase [Acorus gramineus]
MASTSEFKVRGKEAVLVGPARPTRHEFKKLSDLDDQMGLRFQIPALQFYRYNRFMAGKDPAKVIKETLAKGISPLLPVSTG